MKPACSQTPDGGNNGYQMPPSASQKERPTSSDHGSGRSSRIECSGSSISQNQNCSQCARRRDNPCCAGNATDDARNWQDRQNREQTEAPTAKCCKNTRAEGWNCSRAGAAIAEGWNSARTGAAIAEGYNSTRAGAAIVEGYNSTRAGAAIAEGYNSTRGGAAIAEGCNSTRGGPAITESWSSTRAGAAIAEGYNSTRAGAAGNAFDARNGRWPEQDDPSRANTCTYDSQQTGGQSNTKETTDMQNTSQLPNDENAHAQSCVQSQRDRARRHTCRLHKQKSNPSAPESPFPQPKVMSVAPPFKGITAYKGDFQDVKLSDYRGRYLCFFFYPLDFTFVCPTEIRAMSDIHDKFKEINCAILGCSCDSHFTHLAYIKTPKENNGLGEIKFPLLSDYTKRISCDYNVLTDDGTPLRALFIIDPVGIIRNITINDAGVGRNTDEVLRMVQAIKRVDDFDELCPHGWEPGGLTFEPTRSGALNHYRRIFSTKRDQSNEKLDTELDTEKSSSSTYIEYEKEDMIML